MLIMIKPNADEAQVAAIKSCVEDLGLRAIESQIRKQLAIAAIGDQGIAPNGFIESLPGVEHVLPIHKQYKLASREFHPDNRVVSVRHIPIGGDAIQVIAGPCSVETPEQMLAAAAGAMTAGASLLRGGAFKPRTSPYSFQGMEEEGLKYLADAARPHGMPVVTELMDPRDIDLFFKYGVDVIQIGTRNMQNFRLLKEVGQLQVPVILKRGLSATIKEWLMAAEYIAAQGNLNIILAERGVRSFEPAYRNMLDVSAIPYLKRETHLPVIVDPSHAGGAAWMVPALSLAAIAAGADGLMIECHPNPAQAWSDGEQALTPQELHALTRQVAAVAQASGRAYGQPLIDLPRAS